ncbi:hypothetical protein EKE94_11090 [Mesobaculum littorinae]|uniref:Capsule polysaccharide biosynthesis protein n=1 Tax=Mesobaculum littorinae TaxID=2486419 RepID=A0A438AH10_9RHOB|nr:hypothetical protein [Mesobaculum littorinae]RVV98003.1 hypothetical protein EKE94_11090 [Mesobaculum littorinae]
MSTPRKLRIFYDAHLRDRARAGRHNFSNRIRAAFERHRFEVEFVLNTDAARLQSAAEPGYALFHMDDPFHPRALTMRLAYYFPFWRIEASAKRWEWDVAKARFDPRAIDPEAAALFVRRARNRQFPEAAGPSPAGGYVYVPLQGRLRDHRSFQSMSPIEMLGETLAATGSRPVRAGLHPKEDYDAEDLAALDQIAAVNPRLSIERGPMLPLLQNCDMVVTQNSSVALSGYFFEKPAVLFGLIDFHHIAANVADLGVAEAFQRAASMRPDYARYLYWFLKETTINAGDDTAEAQIIAEVRRRGWVF